MDWQILLIISVLTSSVAVLLQRILLHNDKADPIAYAIIFSATVGIMLFGYALINGFELPDFHKYWLPATVTILLFTVGDVLYAKALQAVEASIFSVLFATNVIWVIAGSVFIFDERLGLQQIIGALLIIVSVALLADRTGKLRLDRGILLGLLCGAVYGLAMLLWIYVGKHSEPIAWNAMTFILPAVLLLAVRPKTTSKMKPFLKKEVMARVAVLGLLVSISSACLLNAYNHGDASVVAPLVQTEIFLITLLAVIFLHERKNLILKLFAAFICLSGVLLTIN